ncbi:MAG: hypothetical protein MRJ65_10595 [Candidatus Brocadiaceae bacterium]|nr:hypothetical protein [Candidatus Brocadiaceae bacterium]
MDLLTRDIIKELIEKRERWCVSLYLPTHRFGKETKQDSIRLGNLLREAEQQLVSGGYRPPDIQKALEPAQKLVGDSMFWRYQGDGLALFLSKGFVRSYRLPHSFEELVVVTDRFHIKPLLPLLSGDGRFFILALSQNEIRLLQGSRYRICEIELENVPPNLEEALKYDDPEKQLQFHTKTGGPGKRAAIFHSHGGGIDDTKENILRYFRKIASGVHEILRQETAPLVLSGVEYLFPLYREASSYQHILDQGISGNPEEMSPEDLHKRAWSLVEPIFRKSEEESAARYRNLLSSEKSSHDITKIVPASFYGKIDLLFVAIGIQQWGTFDPKRNVVCLHAKAEPHDEDLLDFAAVHTFVNGGTIYAVNLERMPNTEPIAALYRY